MHNKSANERNIEIGKKCDDAASYIQTPSVTTSPIEADDDASASASTGATEGNAGKQQTTSKKRTKGTEKLVLDLNDRSKYTKEVSV